ncbi:hypothetical protein [Thiomicrorhabdus sp.]|uniref:hypothetical protein n=1 Tax=Thiomicrorhabdus sp. TaxID=2039724 RepID=UPI0029C6C9F8|nr:hypothetical protein [Thiomicrorhabdus sp.]
MILERLGSVGCHFRTLLFAVSIPYFAVSQSILLALDVYSKFAQSETYLYLVILLLFITTLVATALFIGHSLQLSKIEDITRKVTLLGTAYFFCTVLVFISIFLPYTIGVGGIANVQLEGPLNLSISSTGQGDCEFDFFVTVQNRAKAPVSIIEPKISHISIRPDPLHSNLHGYASTSDTLALAASSGTSKVIILKPNGMEWIHFRLSIPGFTHEIAEQFLKKIKLGDNDSSYRVPRIEVEFYLQSDGNMISDEVKTWVSMENIIARGIDH